MRVRHAARMACGVLAALLVATVAGCGASTEPAESPSPSATVDAALGQLATDFIATLVAEDFQAAVGYFDDDMLDALPAAALAATWQQLIEQVGAYESELDRRQEATGGYDAVIVTARFEASPLDIRVVFGPDGRIAGLFFQPATDPTTWQAPPYADPAGIREADVTIGDDEWQVPGTLTTPRAGGPWPAVVLVHGSGPNDRDETIGPNRPFRDLALGLSARGIAVLAYDKRTWVHSSAMAALDDLTVQEEVVDDAVLAVRLLRASDGVDPDRVFVLGHSLGGMLAPRIAQASDGLAGLVVMAGPARPLEELILEQQTYLAERDGTVTAEEQRALDGVSEQVGTIQDPALEAGTPPEHLLGVPASYWLDLRGYEPTAVAAGLGLPVLVLQGERDYQVTMTDFALWDDALASRPGATLTSFPELNHLMMAVTPQRSASVGDARLSGPEEYQVAGHVAAEVLDAVVAFLRG